MSASSPLLTAAKQQRLSLCRSFGQSFAAALVLFLPFLIIDEGFFLYCGDFNSQQQPFTYHMTQMIKAAFAEGDFPAYSWATDLGTGFVEGYSFYLLGSPFFWLGTLFPQSWTPYLLAPLLCLKFAVAATTATLWARRYTKTTSGAELAGLLYAFCGFNIYNIFFNHFLDVAAVFPLLLWSVDEFFENNRRAVFPLTAALCLCVNYFFFVGQVVFVALYFFLRLLGGDWKPGWKKFGVFCFEALLGIGLAMAIALPSFFQVINNPRVGSFYEGLDILFYWRTQQYLAIFTSAFLPQDPPYLPNLFPDSAIKWTSMSAYLPFVGMAGVLAWMHTNKHSFFHRLLLACLAMAFIPALNSVFYAFNSSYYCRWFYMPLLVMAMVTVRALEEAPRAEWLRSLHICGTITLAYLVFIFLPHTDQNDELVLGIADDPARLLGTLGIALGSIGLLYLLVTYCRSRRKLMVYVTAFSAALGVIIGIFTIACGKFPQREGDADYKIETYDYREDIAGWFDSADESYFRIDPYESYTNLNLWLDRSSLQFFNSTVDPSIMEFYPTVGVKRDVSSKPEHDDYALRGLLNVRYTLMPSDRLEEFYDEVSYSEDWYYAATVGTYTILENQNFVPFGTTYDYYITQEQYDALTEANRANILLRALVLSDEQLTQYGDLLQPLSESSLSVVSYAAYIDDCADRAAAAADSFITDDDGFTAVITTESEELVFFAVPYNKGWHATVNGSPAQVEKVDNGLCAVKVDAGESTIRFDYHAVGQKAGVLITLVCAVLWAAYAVFLLVLRRMFGVAAAAPVPALSPRQELDALEPWQPEAGAAAESPAEEAGEDICENPEMTAEVRETTEAPEIAEAPETADDLSEVTTETIEATETSETAKMTETPENAGNGASE